MTDLLVRLFIKDYKNINSASVRKQYGTLSGLTGILLNILLFAGKLVAGLFTGAISVIADAFNNLTDAGSSIVTLAGFKIAGKKSDEDHPFGHGRAEYVAGLIVSLVILVVGFELLRSSFEKILHPEPIAFSGVSAVILGASVLMKLWLGLFNRRLGRRIDSAMLRATATDSFTDAIATFAVLAGLCIFLLTGLNIDGYLGLVVSLFIMYSGYNAVKDTVDPLLGQAPDPAFVQGIHDTVLAHDQIIGIHDLIVHNYGPDRIMISLHAEVPGDGNIMQIHDTIDLIEMELREKYGCDATIHMDPLAPEDDFIRKLRADVGRIIAGIDERLSIHDLRATNGPTHTNIIFDVVVPFHFRLSDDALVATLKAEIQKLNPTYYAVITVDRDLNSYSDKNKPKRGGSHEKE